MATFRDGDPLMQAIILAAREQDLTPLLLSCEADVAYSSLDRSITGRSSPTLRKIRKLLDVLDMDIQLIPRESHDESH